MNAIVIVFIPMRNGQLDQATKTAVRDIVKPSIDGNGSDKGSFQLSDRNQSTPPLWTWFIENPRNRAA